MKSRPLEQVPEILQTGDLQEAEIHLTTLHSKLAGFEENVRQRKSRREVLADQLTAAAALGSEAKAGKIRAELQQLLREAEGDEETELALRRAIAQQFAVVRELSGTANRAAVVAALRQRIALFDAVQAHLEATDSILWPIAAQFGFDLDRDGDGEDCRWTPNASDLRRWRFFTGQLAIALKKAGYDVEAPEPTPTVEINWIDKLFHDLRGDR